MTELEIQFKNREWIKDYVLYRMNNRKHWRLIVTNFQPNKNKKKLNLLLLIANSIPFIIKIHQPSWIEHKNINKFVLTII